MAAPRRWILLLLAAALGTPRSAAPALIFEVISQPVMEYDPSVRSVSMGGASGAVFWGDAPNHWANPALLGYAQGVRYEDALERMPTEEINTGFETFVLESRATARREVIGYGGLGLALTERPFDGPGGIRFVNKGTEIMPGFPSSTTEFSDDVWSWSVGISASRLIQSYSAISHREAPAITRFVDLAAGYSHKATGESGQVAAHDWGLLARGSAPFELRGANLRFEGAYAYSVLNTLGAPFMTTDRHHRNALSAHLAVEATPGPLARMPDWLQRGFQPLFSVGGAWDADHEFTEFRADTLYRSYHSNGRAWGTEISLLNVLFVRGGQDRSENTSTGWGFALPLGKFASFRYDRSHVDNFLEATRRSWSVWVDPLAIVRARR